MAPSSRVGAGFNAADIFCPRCWPPSSRCSQACSPVGRGSAAAVARACCCRCWPWWAAGSAVTLLARLPQSRPAHCQHPGRRRGAGRGAAVHRGRAWRRVCVRRLIDGAKGKALAWPSRWCRTSSPFWWLWGVPRRRAAWMPCWRVGTAVAWMGLDTDFLPAPPVGLMKCCRARGARPDGGRDADHGVDPSCGWPPSSRARPRPPSTCWPSTLAVWASKHPPCTGLRPVCRCSGHSGRHWVGYAMLR